MVRRQQGEVVHKAPGAGRFGGLTQQHGFGKGGESPAQLRGWVNRLAVHPVYRGNGIGKRLIEAGERILRQRGLTIFAALVEEGNSASRALFVKADYELLPEVVYYSKRESSDA